ARVTEVLAQHKITAWLMTRGFIRPRVLKALAAHHQWVKVTVPLTTLDRGLQRTLEPLTAPPRLRLRQIRALQNAGIQVQVALDPLLPGLTDTQENLGALLRALEELRVRHVSAGYMFLRPGIREELALALERFGWDQIVLDAYRDGPMLSGG